MMVGARKLVRKIGGNDGSRDICIDVQSEVFLIYFLFNIYIYIYIYKVFV